MSNNESFIDEVTEEVQRDRLFLLFRKYGWVGVLAVLLVVGGAGYNEWRKGQARDAAQSLGDAFLAAVESDDPAARAAALETVEAPGDAAALRDLLRAGELVAAGETDAASDLFNSVAETPGLSPAYADLARLKAVMTGVGSEDARLSLLADLARPGGPYRLLAMEQMALIEAGRGDSVAAIDLARAILEDDALSRGLRERSQNLIVAMGGSVAGADTPNAADDAAGSE